MQLESIFAVTSTRELSAYSAFLTRHADRLEAYLALLAREYAVCELPRAIVWTSRRTASELISDIPLPAYTNEHRIVFTPELAAWQDIYLSQLDGLDTPEAESIRAYYRTRLSENHVLQILGHELAHHSAYFPDSDYETGIWFEEGMVEYLSRKFFLADAEFEEEAEINRRLVALLTPRYGNEPLERFGAQTYSEGYGRIFFEYWRSFLAVQALVDARGGDAAAVLREGKPSL